MRGKNSENRKSFQELIGATFNVVITAISHDGVGIGRVYIDSGASSVVIFVPFTAIGDVVEARVVRVSKNMLFGEISVILGDSKQRTQVDCDHFMKCGGCELRHIEYKAECDLKRQLVHANLSRIGKVGEAGIDFILDDDIYSDSFLRYRNNVQFPIRELDGKVSFGFFEKGSDKLCRVDDCLLVPREFIEIATRFCEFAEHSGVSVCDDRSGVGIIRHLILRKSAKTDELLVCIVANPTGSSKIIKKYDEFELKLPKFFKNVNDKVSVVVINYNSGENSLVLGVEEKVIFGDGYINDTIFGKTFSISTKSFFQINHEVMENVYKRAINYMQEDSLNPKGVLLDLYCGIGSIGISAADKFDKVIGVEIVKDAVENARRNVVINGIKNCSFYKCDAKNIHEVFEKINLEKPDVISIDPPRKGVDKQALASIIKLGSKRIVYISCNSSTLARDIQLLSSHYTLKRATVANMFPRTCHIETVVLMSRVDK